MGLKPGPIFRETLRAVLNAKLNGRLITKNDEIQFVRRYVQQTPTPARPDGGP
jgi:tRNA nucleotidyltransferase (CCA-adding enzyme)